jgi:hypothetical protein
MGVIPSNVKGMNCCISGGKALTSGNPICQAGVP